MPEICKATFPYELYHEIGEIRDASAFPGYSKFRSSLLKADPEHVKEFAEIVRAEIEKGSITNDG